MEEAHCRGEERSVECVRGREINTSHYDVPTTLLGTGWLYIILKREERERESYRYSHSHTCQVIYIYTH